MLYIEILKRASTTTIFQCFFTRGRSLRRCGQAITRKIGNTATQRQNDNPIGGIISTTPRPIIVLPDHAIAVITTSRYPWLDSHFIKIIANSFVDKMREISQSFEARLLIWRGTIGTIKICYSHLKSAAYNLKD